MNNIIIKYNLIINTIFIVLDNSRISLIILQSFEKIIFSNDCNIIGYRLQMRSNTKAVCGSYSNVILYKYIYWIISFFILLISFIIITKKIFYVNEIFLYQLTFILIIITLILLKILLKYIIYYYYNMFSSIEKKFMLEISYIPYEDGDNRSEEYIKKFKFFNTPEDNFNFFDIKEIFISWNHIMQTHPDEILCNQFFDSLHIEDVKQTCDSEKIPYTGNEISFFNIYAYHHFRYTAAKKLALELSFSKHKICNILLIFLICILLLLDIAI